MVAGSDPAGLSLAADSRGIDELKRVARDDPKAAVRETARQFEALLGRAWAQGGSIPVRHGRLATVLPHDAWQGASNADGAFHAMHACVLLAVEWLRCAASTSGPLQRALDGVIARLLTLEQALRLNPGSLVYLEIIGYLMVLLGDAERGIALLRNAMERNPHYLPHAHFGLWADHLRRGELEEAYQAALQYRDATFFWRSLMRACCLGLLGRTTEAQGEVAELLRQRPSFAERGRILIGHYIKPVELQERVAEGLRQGGLALG